ncbi:F-box protein CPR1-like [Salvia splendens]|uniref:F-box protein CPR1-like n=1 Tax=Salvia splendens TaxID=180675 RepID=UPI001C26E3F8|nr:F-box protein CPR1-like [Salvia splendens]
MKTADNSKMDQDFFEYLPSEIVVNILSRLPTRAATVCKCVCKPWLGLLATPEFVNSHISRSVPGIAVETRSRSYDVIEFVDELGLSFDDEHRTNVAFNFELPFDEPMHSSANGLIFLYGVIHEDLILCNPITRDYIKLPCPRQTSPKDQIDTETFGFGVSKMTGQYKVVRLFSEKPLHEEYKIECQVYNVGTGSWRKVPSGSIDSSLRLYEDVRGVLLNGNLHWMVDKTTNFSCRWVLRFDLET